MAAKKRHRGKRSGGSMMNMRAGFQSAVGTGKKKKRKKSQVTMQQTLLWGVGVAVVIVLIWRLTL